MSAIMRTTTHACNACAPRPTFKYLTERICRQWFPPMTEEDYLALCWRTIPFDVLSQKLSGLLSKRHLSLTPTRAPDLEICIRPAGQMHIRERQTTEF